MKIGVPRALLYYYYFPLWQKMLFSLGHEVVVSPETNKEIVDLGVKKSVPEICVPIKIFNGHVENLVKKNVDFVFVPRMVSVEKGCTFCPKFLGLPDMVQSIFPELEGKILSPKIEMNSEVIAEPHCYQDLKGPLNVEDKELSRALKVAKKHWLKFRSISKKGYLISEALDLVEQETVPPMEQKGDITIGLIGYVYDIYDGYVSMNVAKRMRELGVNVITFDMLNERDINREVKTMSKVLFWTFSNKIFGAGMHFYKNKQVDGIIHITAFGCGPDSLLGKMLELDSEKFNKPFMTVRVDEHTGETHLQTRIEAFVDMLRKKKKKR
ncbi:MAG: acyl-CoA dehydratase activase-related protein [Bacillota bacterium]|jgi:predicted nucleotide-binding protein (sugar kinase/HSP70/actin superfamily)